MTADNLQLGLLVAIVCIFFHAILFQKTSLNKYKQITSSIITIFMLLAIVFYKSKNLYLQANEAAIYLVIVFINGYAFIPANGTVQTLYLAGLPTVLMMLQGGVILKNFNENLKNPTSVLKANVLFLMIVFIAAIFLVEGISNVLSKIFKHKL
jgi:hypothetical protein